MKKTIIKCDKCKRDLDREKESEYYEISKEHMPGWASIDYSMGRNTHWQLCKKCFKPPKK